ncbi:type I polyketide synthase, partial [Nocardia tenerifensis]
MSLPLDGGIAVVGIACRFPGADNPAALWSLLRAGTAVDAPISDARWEPSTLAGLSEAERAVLRRGAFLDDIAGFDAGFFRVSPREAAAMDPQQRLMLELGWEALEDAGIPADAVGGTRTGVFVGVAGDDYSSLVRAQGAEAITPHTFTGASRALVANRVSYFLEAKGPSLVVDAGQASSLVAVHLAAASLRRGESEIAIAGGVTLRLSPHHAIAAHRFGALSPDGRCHVFDTRANGFGQGEGGGAVVLKPLAAALADGDRVYCVIRGSGVSNDGGGEQLSTPTANGQAEAIRAAYQQAGLDPAAVVHVELHGTGTPVGDPVEAAALGAVLGAARAPGDPLAVGSIKSNIGHLEAAAGIAGFLKTALCVHAGMLVPTADFHAPHPALALDERNLRVQTRVEPVRTESALFGVSSFGVGGTNCHVAVSAPPAADAPVGPSPGGAVRSSSAAVPVPLVLSAASAAALRAQAIRLTGTLDSGAAVADVGWSLITSRSQFAHRAVVLGADHDAARAGLTALAAGEPSTAVSSGLAAGLAEPVFIFPGQGAQWIGMAAELLDCSPVFAEAIDTCTAALAPFVDWPLHEVLRGDGTALDRVDVVQPALWAVMIALTRVWQSLGVRPAAVVGHSQGEIAAACVAGILSLADGARIVALRSQVIAAQLAGLGGMASIALSAEALRELLAEHPEVGLAALNGPNSTVVSGPTEPLEHLLELLERRDVRVRRVPVDYASHSVAVDAVTAELLEVLAPITPRAGEIPFYSTVTGARLHGAELSAAYWCRNLRETVLFEPVVTALLDAYDMFIEPSPHPMLTVPIQETAAAAGVAVTAIGTVRRGEGSLARLLTSAAEAWTAGVPVDWAARFEGADARRVPLPTYPFQRTRHWFDSVTTATEDDLSATALRLRETRTEDLPDAVLDLVRRHTAVALGFDDPAAVADTRPLRAQGMTSIVGATLCAELSKASGVYLSPAAVFDYPTPHALSAYLTDLLAGTTRTTPPPATPLRQGADDDPVAIVGMACRYPGGVATPADFWRLIAEGRDVIGAAPADRGWQLDGDSAAVRGGFLYDAAEFDAAFFGISPREALAMDPQQRLLLETTWEAIESAGIDPTTLRGSDTGVFIGAMAQDYGPRLHEPADGSDGYRLTGTTASVASGRLAYTLGLAGPAVTVDTACSSSLVALHLAAAAVRRGECTMALAGGVTVLSSPGIFVEFARQNGLSADGRCKAFAGAADGTGWGEGVGLLLLERLSVAQANNHEVLALVRGSAINQDGASNGLTAPSGPAQQRVIRQALADAGLRAAEVDAVEAHGTGTRLGDPIEARALLATYGQDRERPLWLGSVKSNIGHTQAAAGIAGVLKMIMAMRHGTLPRTLHIDEPTPHVDWAAGAVRLLTEPQDWPEQPWPRRAGISSFGISGTNAHVVLEQAPDRTNDDAAQPVQHDLDAPWLLSATAEQAVRAQARRLREHLSTHPQTAPADVGHTLATGRPAFELRAAVFGATVEQRGEVLAALHDGQPHPLLVRGTARPRGKTVFVFPGQGSQWVGMGAELLDSTQVFADRIACCERALAPFVDWSLTDVLRDGALDRVDVVQPALWAMMVALAETWRSFGVEPDAVIGHSQGEIAAACVAGILTLDDGARISALRSRIIAGQLAGKGAMASIALPTEAIDEVLAAHHDVAIAAHNGPSATVVAGQRHSLEQLLVTLEQQGVRVRRIPVDYASHTSDVEVIRDELAAALAPITPQPGTIAFYSTVTGDRLDGTELTADYWYRNLRRPVLFHPVVQTLLPTHSTFVEPSPHPVLTTPVEDAADATGATVVSVGTLRRDDGSRSRLLAAAATAWVGGVAVDRSGFQPGARRISLPTYPFQRSRYWLDAPAPAPAVDDSSEFWAAVAADDTDTVAAVLGLRANRPDWLGEATSVLARWRELRRERADLDALRYSVEWTVSTALGTGTPSGRWLVVVPEGLAQPPWLPALRNALRACGAEVIELRVGTQSRTELRDQLPDALSGVLSLLALAGTTLPEHPAVPTGTGATLTLVHALADAAAAVPLWTLTCAAVAVDRAETVREPVQQQAWGLGRVVALEQPERWGGLIDLPAAPDERVIERLLAALAQRVEDQLALRESGAFVRRLVPARPAEPVARGPREVVLITGGTGALGTQLARRLAHDGARHLVLASRRGPAAPGAAELTAELRALGAEISVVACDVGDRAAVAQLLASFPVTSIFHAAGTLDDAVVDALTVDQLDRVLRVKAEGARHLHELTVGMELTDFVLFSSVSGVLGIPGQGGYSPGNAYLDALAEHRRGLGLPATSYAWGPWAGDGMAATGSVEDRLRRHGVATLDPARALEILLRDEAEERACVMVADIRWDRFFLAYTEARRRPLIEELPSVRALLDTGAGGRADTAGNGLTARLGGLPVRQRPAAVLAEVRSQVAAVLGHADAMAVDVERPFRDLGFDSLTGVELRNRLGAEAGERLPSSLVFDHPTPAAVARYLESRLFGADDAEAAATTPAARPDDDPVVIVAMACRYPGAVDSPEDLWRLVAEGRDATGEFPDDRGWDLARLRETPDGPGGSVTTRGGFRYDAAEFDATFFGISPREALAMDPQQRLLLETTWETIESAGIDPTTLRGSDTGVFVGLSYQDYQTRLTEPPEELAGYLLTGTTASVASGRVAYTFGLEGPAVTIDTACSSSLVALHLAAQALRNDECTMAVAGGVALMATPHMFTEFSRQHGLSPDGRCKAFASTADGFGSAEGVGLALLERLSDARRNGHPVLAVVRG